MTPRTPRTPLSLSSVLERMVGSAESNSRRANLWLAALIAISVATAVAWIFVVPMLEAPDETVHFEYSTALYSAGGLVAPRDAARLAAPAGRTIPHPKALEDQAAVAVIAEKPDVKAAAGYGSAAYYASVDRAISQGEPTGQLLNPPLLRYYPFGYYLLDAAAMGLTSLFTTSPVALFFAARLLSAALLVPSLLFTFLLLRRLRCGLALSLALTAVIGLFPMTSMIASSVQADNLSFTLVVLALLAALELRGRPHHRGWIAVLGLALGALAVTKIHFFGIVAIATVAMIVSQRLHMRDSRGWLFELVVLAVPAIALESIQLWTQWGAPSLITPAQLGDVPDYRAALAGGPVAVAAYGLHIVTFTFLDNTFGREFGSFWGVFGWVDTPLVLGSPAITVIVWLLIAGMSIGLLGCTLVRLGQVAYRLARVARRGRWRGALRMAFSNPVANAYLLFCVFLFSVEGYPGVQGRYYFPLLPGVFWVALKYAPRALPGKFGPALFRMQVVGLVAYTIAGAFFAFPTLAARYYAHGRAVVAVSRDGLRQLSSPGRYAITRVRLPEASLGVGTLPTGRVGVVGWAIDDVAAAPAMTVFVDIDGVPFQEAVYGDDSPAAAAALGSDRYSRCGFDAILDTTHLAPGPHELTIRVVSADGGRLFAPGPPVEFQAGSPTPPASS